VLGLAKMLSADWAGAFGLDTPESLNALYPARYLLFLQRFLGPGDPSNGDLRERFVGFSPPSMATDLAHRWLTLSSVRFVIVPPDKRLHAPGLGLVYDRDARIYEFDSPLPRASVFHRVRPVRDGDAALSALAAPAFDVRRELVLEAPAAVVPSAPPGNEHAAIVGRGAGMVAIEATLAAPGYVMLNDTWYPGWVATVDGQETPVLQADYLFRAVAVPAGSHRIVYTYHSAAVRNGIIASVLGLLILLGCVVAAVRSRPAHADAASMTTETAP
jgi:Bacterial membrane protein YfhO